MSIFKRVSWTQMTAFRKCKKMYYLNYIEGFKKIQRDAALEFGIITEAAILSPWTVKNEDEEATALAMFKERWKAVLEMELNYGKKWTWESLNKAGFNIVKDFFKGVRSRMRDGEVQVELLRKINEEYEEYLGYGFADWIGEFWVEEDDAPDSGSGWKKETVVDIKTASSLWPAERMDRDEQAVNYHYLNEGAVSDPEVRFHVGYVIGVKTKGGYTKAFTREKGMEDSQLIHRRYLEHIRETEHEFDYDPVLVNWDGRPCQMCDFKSICFNQPEVAKETLERKERK